MSIKQIVSISILSFILVGQAYADRIKDIASIAGVRSNQLIGYGLVVGLNGTGDQNQFTKESFKNMLKELGINLPIGIDPKSKNVAAVMLTAELPPFVKPGQTIDITVASIGDAKSLRGGTLLMTPLKGADGNIYAIAQGNVIAGGVSALGADQSSVTVNIPSSGRIPNGASVERSAPSPFAYGDSLYLNLHSPDFTTAKRLVDAINRLMGPQTATALDATSVKVSVPKNVSERVSFISALENFELERGTAPARIVVNSRSGTIVIGEHVQVRPAAVTHGNLVVTITENNSVSQPNALADGTTEQVVNSSVSIEEEERRMFLFEAGPSLKDVVRAVNLVGATPGDLMAILEALKVVGALHGELVVI